jgi:hypothetical protein
MVTLSIDYNNINSKWIRNNKRALFVKQNKGPMEKIKTLLHFITTSKGCFLVFYVPYLI